MTEITQEYFKNKQEQAEIAIAVSKVIPKNVRYYNLLIVFAEMTARFTNDAFKEAIYGQTDDEEDH